MEMIIHLDEDIFEIVKNGTKDVEVRLNDEKRRKLSIGDTLIFLKRPEEIEKIYAIVTDLKYYSNFEELSKNYSIEKMYLPGYTKEYFVNDILGRFYSNDEQNKYGVVAIEFKIKED